jgi:RNA recognition motif-containing protein
LRTLLVEVDPRVRVRLGVDRLTGRSRGFAFAEFADAAMAADAIRRFDSLEHRGRRLRVNDADDKPPTRAPRPPRPGGGAPPAFRATEFSARDFPPPEASEFPPFRKNGGSRRGLRAKKRSLR